jgi:hypothetical protein
MLGRFHKRLAKLEQQMAKRKNNRDESAGRRLVKQIRVVFGLDPPTAEFPLPPAELVDRVREIYGFPVRQHRVGLDGNRSPHDIRASLRSPAQTEHDTSNQTPLSDRRQQLE